MPEFMQYVSAGEGIVPVPLGDYPDLQSAINAHKLHEVYKRFEYEPCPDHAEWYGMVEMETERGRVRQCVSVSVQPRDLIG
jgi:hypothetical protein